MWAAATVAAIGLSGCGGDSTTTVTEPPGAQSSGAGLPQGSEPASLDPAEFTTEIDNPYWPMPVGARWVYRETDVEGEELKVVVEVLDRTKQIANGVEALVVRDTVTDAKTGEVIEDTFDWYAQDADGNVWYMGEDTAEYEDGKVVTRAGSFEAGVDGAEAGVIMPADPQPGMAYRQEYYEGEAEDRAEVVSLGSQVQVPAGHFEATLVTRDLVPLEPKVEELKFYAKGVGPVLALGISGGFGAEQLVAYSPG
jgi:hypothetical protein